MAKKKGRVKVAHKKRHGHHQKKTKRFIDTYWPYLPLVISALISLAISSMWHPAAQIRSQKDNVLAYATNISQQGLLQETNNQRSAHGKHSLELNSQLSRAAQAKAEDMANRNYWSHYTPDGSPPWIFIDSTGYSYTVAGENLAYGFLNSASTVSGWMNSPSHRDNMLDSGYVHVGFGFANSENYQNYGQQTIVVALYAAPAQAIAQTPPQPPTTPKATAPTISQSPAPPSDTPADTAELATLQPEPPSEQEANTGAGTEEAPMPESPHHITRVQAMTKGKAPWSVFIIGVISTASILLFLIRHGVALRKLIVNGEKYILHHPVLDSIVIGVVILGYTLTRAAGTIL